MELVRILRELWRHRLLLALAAFAATGAAVLVTCHVQLNPPELREKTGLRLGAASTQVLIDTRRSALADLSPDLIPLTNRAAVYARFMRSTAVKQDIARAADLPVTAIATQGPYSDGQPPSEARATALVTEHTPYRLVFDAPDPSQDQVPIISIFAQAPSPRMAERLAQASVVGLQRHVAELAKQGRVPDSSRVAIRQLQRPVGGVVVSGAANRALALAVAVGVFLVGCLLILFGSALARDWRRTDPLRASDLAPLPVPAPATNGHAHVAANGHVPAEEQPPVATNGHGAAETVREPQPDDWHPPGEAAQPQAEAGPGHS